MRESMTEAANQNPTYVLVQAMIRGDRCGMCGRADLRQTDYAVRNNRIVDVPRRQIPRLCWLCMADWQMYRREPAPELLRTLPSHTLAEALASIERPAAFTLAGIAAMSDEQWLAMACGYRIVCELRRRADECAAQMRAASRRDPSTYRTSRHREAVPA